MDDGNLSGHYRHFLPIRQITDRSRVDRSICIVYYAVGGFQSEGEVLLLQGEIVFILKDTREIIRVFNQFGGDDLIFFTDSNILKATVKERV